MSKVIVFCTLKIILTIFINVITYRLCFQFSAMFLSKCAANYAPLTPLSMFKRTVLINPNATAYVHAFKADKGVNIYISIYHKLRMVL